VSACEKEILVADVATDNPEVRFCMELATQLEQLVEELPESVSDPDVRRPIQLFLCLFRDLESGEINYDASEGTSFLNNSRQAVREAIRFVRHRLAALDRTGSLCRPVYVRQLAAGMRNSVVAESSLRRELLFILSQSMNLPRVLRLGMSGRE
jgi:hypothetical protein